MASVDPFLSGPATGTALADTAEAKLREGCTGFGVRGDSTDAELDAIKPFDGERN